MERKKVILYFLAVVLILVAVFLPGFSELQKLREENDDLKKRIKMLEEHNDALKEEIQKLHEDPAYQELKARQKFGILKEGEYIYKKSESGAGEGGAGVAPAGNK